MANSSMNKKREYLNSLLKEAGYLAKEAQDIKHMSLDASQPTIGNKMQRETERGSQGNYASDPSVDAQIKGTIEVADNKVEGPEDEMAARVFSRTGNPVRTITPDGVSTSLPKTASLMNKIESVVSTEMRKQAAYNEDNVVTATEVMRKIAALDTCRTNNEVSALMQDIDVDFKKLAAYNPLFNEACEHVMMRKMAEEIAALSEAEGIPEEAAAEMLDTATAADPAAAAQLEDQVQGEALSELADMQASQAEMIEGLQTVADEASNALGQPISPDDIVMAVQDVMAQADQMGVEPEVLIQAAAEDMMQGAGDDVTGEDMAAAEQLLEEAAAEGVSPEEVISGLSEGIAQEAPIQEAPIQQDIEKHACLNKLASTRRGANLNYILSNIGR